MSQPHSKGVLILLMLSNANAKYPLTHVEIKSLDLGKGLKIKTFPNINNGTLPKRVVIGMIEQDSYVGAYNRNPFNFKHFDLTKLSLAVDNVNVPHSPIETNFADGKFANAYYSLLHGVDRGPLNSGNFCHKKYFRKHTCKKSNASSELSNAFNFSDSFFSRNPKLKNPT